MSRLQVQSLSFAGAVFVVATVITIPYIVIVVVLLFGICRVIYGLNRRWIGAPFGVKRRDWVRLALLCLAYVATFWVYLAQFHGHVRTQVSGGCFKITVTESKHWNNSPTWRMGPSSGAIWLNVPYFQINTPHEREFSVFVAIPIWIPIVLACFELALAYRYESELDCAAPKTSANVERHPKL